VLLVSVPNTPMNVKVLDLLCVHLISHSNVLVVSVEDHLFTVNHRTTEKDK